MYAITGITGQVGGAMARTLLDANKTVRAVVRNVEKGRTWAAKGCETAVAEMEDTCPRRRPNSTHCLASPKLFG